jgi:CBS domain-containing protein
MEGETVVGIITERDLLERVLAGRRDPDQTFVEDVMTGEVLCCQPHTSIEEARAVMKNRRSVTYRCSTTTASSTA